MSRIALIFILVLSFSRNGTARNEFALTVGAEISSGQIRQTIDGGYIISGVLATLRMGDALLIKLDANGQTEWSKTFGGPDFEFAVDAFQTTDGGYIVAGTTLSYTFSNGLGPNYDGFLAKLDSQGRLIWTRNFFGRGDDYVTGIVPSSDGGVVVLGETYSFEAENPEDWTNLDLYLAKFDATGTLIWTRHFGTRGDDHSSHVIATSDGGYLLSGWFLNGDGGFVAKADHKGKFEWIRSFEQLFGVQSVTETDRGSYLATGTIYTNPDIFDQADISIIQLNGKGKILSKYNYGRADFSERPSTIVSAKNGGSLLAMSRYGLASGIRESLIARLNSKGRVVWTRRLTTQNYPAASTTSEGGFAFISSDSYSALQILKLNSNGKISSCEGIRSTRIPRKKFPSPVRTPEIHFKSNPPAVAVEQPLKARAVTLSANPECPFIEE